MAERDFFVHRSAYAGTQPCCRSAQGTRILAFLPCHEGRADRRTLHPRPERLNVDGGVMIGNNVKIQNNVSIYTGAVIEDDVFLGPSCVLTNVSNPRSQVNRHSLYEKTVFSAAAPSAPTLPSSAARPSAAMRSLPPVRS